MIPSSVPQMKQDAVRKILSAKGIDRNKFPVCVLAVRGYYLAMGKSGFNDRGIFDDACFIDSPTLFVTVNWNTDPSSYRKGKGTGSSKGMASLKPGVWEYKIGPHKGVSPACRQAAPVTVIRDGINGDYEDTGDFAINHHWGRSNSTSSAGCQTAPVNQWPSYINPLVSELKRYDQKVFKYVLITEAERAQILGETLSDAPEATHPPVSIPKPAPRSLKAARDLIKQFEGCSLKAYLCPARVWTIGWGSTRLDDGRPVRPGLTITQDFADFLLEQDVKKFARYVEQLVKVPISDNAFCALTSFCYNVGPDIDDDDIAEGLGDSTLLKKLNAGKPLEEVAAEFLKWNKGGGRVLPGLVKRREMERQLFLKV